MFNIVSALVLLALLAAGVVIHVAGIPVDLSEQGPFEVGQMIVSGVAALIWGYLAWLLWRPETGGSSRIHVSVALFFAVLCLLVVGRESSWFSEYGASETVEEFLELILGGALGLVILGLVVWWFTAGARRQKLFRRFIRHRAFGWAILSFLLVLSGDIFEKRIFALDSNLLWEELLELMGFTAIAIAGLAGLAEAKALRR